MTEQESGVARPPYPREPNVHSGGEQEPESGGRPIPPYDDRQKTGKGQDELAQERGGAGKSDVGPRDVSQDQPAGSTRGRRDDYHFRRRAHARNF
jgi:hypothetical protein